MIPSIGRIVHYKLGSGDVAQIEINRGLSFPQFKGNPSSPGEVFPMMITKVWSPNEGSAVQGQVFLDGNDILWVTSRVEGDKEGQWKEPVRIS